jgi:hypothetical protein
MAPTTPSAADQQTWPDDTGYLGRTAAAAERVASSLPGGSPLAWRRLAYRAVLSAVLRDAVENDNRGLEPDDAENLSRFVQDAAATASSVAVEYRDDTFEIVLSALLEDWVDNWDPGDEEEDEDEDD